jgi:hypothetical protein
MFQTTRRDFMESFDVSTSHNGRNWEYKVTEGGNPVARGDGYRTQHDAGTAGQARRLELYGQAVEAHYLNQGCKPYGAR